MSIGGVTQVDQNLTRKEMTRHEAIKSTAGFD
jgi:hypothetical protein